MTKVKVLFLSSLVLLSLSLLTLRAQTSIRSNSQAPYNLAWLRDFASPTNKDADNKWNPRFRTLIQQSFPQKQTFWREQGTFPTVPGLVLQFLGVPEGVSIVGDRFVTMDGCVPHACSARGMVWADTRASGKPLVLFIAPQDVSAADNEKRVLQHLWIFSNSQLNWQSMPPEFKSDLARWYSSYRATWAKEYRMDVLMLTLVEPSGLSYDLSPGLFPINPS